jgi:hypothetical protein
MCPPLRKFIRKYFHIKESSSRLGWVVETSKKPHKSKSPAAHIAEKKKEMMMIIIIMRRRGGVG